MNARLILFSYLTLFVFGLIDNSRGPLYPEILSFFQVSKTQGSLFFSLSSAMGFVFTLMSNFFFRKFGVNRTVLISIFLMVLSPVLFGLFGSSSNSFFFFLSGSIALGTSVGLLSVGINLILARSVTEHKKQKYFSGLHSMYGLASFAAPLLLSLILSLGVSWQKFFYILSIIPFILLISFIRVEKDEYKSLRNNEDKLPRSISTPLGILMGLYVCSEILMSTRIVIFLTEYWQYDQVQATSSLSVFFFLLLLGRASFAIFAKKINALKILKISAISTIILLIIGMNWYPQVLCLTGLTMSYFFPCALSWLSSQYLEASESLIPTVMKFINGMIVLIHAIFGVISDTYSIYTAFSLALIFQFIVLYLLHKQSSYIDNKDLA